MEHEKGKRGREGGGGCERKRGVVSDRERGKERDRGRGIKWRRKNRRKSNEPGIRDEGRKRMERKKVTEK